MPLKLSAKCKVQGAGLFLKKVRHGDISMSYFFIVYDNPVL